MHACAPPLSWDLHSWFYSVTLSYLLCIFIALIHKLQISQIFTAGFSFDYIDRRDSTETTIIHKDAYKKQILWSGLKPIDRHCIANGCVRWVVVSVVSWTPSSSPPSQAQTASGQLSAETPASQDNWGEGPTHGVSYRLAPGFTLTENFTAERVPTMYVEIFMMVLFCVLCELFSIHESKTLQNLELIWMGMNLV